MRNYPVQGTVVTDTVYSRVPLVNAQLAVSHSVTQAGGEIQFVFQPGISELRILRTALAFKPEYFTGQD